MGLITINSSSGAPTAPPIGFPYRPPTGCPYGPSYGPPRSSMHLGPFSIVFFFSYDSLFVQGDPKCSRDGQGPQYLTNKKNKCSYSLFSFPFPSLLFFLSLSSFFPLFPSFFLFSFFSFFLFFQGGPWAPLEAPRITGPSKKVRVDTPVSGPAPPPLLVPLTHQFFIVPEGINSIGDYNSQWVGVVCVSVCVPVCPHFFSRFTIG